MTVRELLIGCGNKRVKEIALNENQAEWRNLTTLDMYPECNPDVVHDLEVLQYPFEDNTFDEIHAYEVLEHTGRQGDWRFFFAQWDEFYRILKPDGQFYGTSPLWYTPWAWGDPGHTRIIGAEQLFYLCRPNYAEVGTTPMTDYRPFFKCDFDALAIQGIGEPKPTRLMYVLKAIKPARV